MGKDKIKSYLLYFEWMGFLAVLLAIWLNELLDIPHFVLGAERTPVNWRESVFESLLVLALAWLVTRATKQFVDRLKYLEGFFVVCARCMKVHAHNQWIPFDQFVKDQADVTISHGLCPECADRYNHVIATL